MSAPSRWLGLDALRGLSIGAMILVNNPGRWRSDHIYAPLRHADWHGCTFTDLVFPTFLFCCGVAIVPAMQRRLQQGLPRGPMLASLLRRVVTLVLLGMFLSAFPLLSFAEGESLLQPVLDVRFPGVLQRIGVCYGVAAALFLFTSERAQRLVLWSCLLLYWPLLVLGSQSLDDPAQTLAGAIDQAVFGEHIYKVGRYDPEGLLSTIPALATCLFGVEAGRVLRSERDVGDKVSTLLRRGCLLLLLGAVWGWFFPINKALWTSSYAVWTGGVAMVGLGLCVWWFEQRAHRRVGTWLQIYGVNALLVFVGSGVLARIVGRMWKVTTDTGDVVSAKEWFFQNALLSWLPPRAASLAFALLWVAVWFTVLSRLFRRGIVWKV